MFTLDWTCYTFWGLGNIFETHYEEWPFVSTLNLKPKFHQLWQCSLESVHQHLHGQQAICWHQHNFVYDLHSVDTAQIWLQHDACPNFQWESHDTWRLKFQLPLLLHEQSNDDWNESLSELFGCFLHFLILKVILNVQVLKFSPL